MAACVINKLYLLHTRKTVDVRSLLRYLVFAPATPVALVLAVPSLLGKLVVAQ
jgi:hypothetical protein